MLWKQLDFEQVYLYIFAAVNIVLSIVVVYFWARFLGYRPENTPKRPRMVRDARGYVPLSEVSGKEGGRS